MQKLRNIKVDGEVKYSMQYDDVAEADKWYGEMQAKADYLPEHTVEDISNPDHAKQLKREAIKGALDDDDFKDLILALAGANPSLIPDELKAKVQAARNA